MDVFASCVVAAMFVKVGWVGDVVATSVLLACDFDRLFALRTREDLEFVTKWFTEGINALNGEGVKVAVDVIFGGSKGFVGGEAGAIGVMAFNVGVSHVSRNLSGARCCG